MGSVIKWSLYRHNKSQTLLIAFCSFSFHNCSCSLQSVMHWKRLTQQAKLKHLKKIKKQNRYSLDKLIHVASVEILDSNSAQILKKCFHSFWHFFFIILQSHIIIITSLCKSYSLILLTIPQLQAKSLGVETFVSNHPALLPYWVHLNVYLFILNIGNRGAVGRSSCITVWKWLAYLTQSFAFF